MEKENNNLIIRDLIYFDFAKAASIWSQFEGGLRERISLTEEKTKDRDVGFKVGSSHLAQANFGTDYSNTSSILESKTLYHDLLLKIEAKFREEKLVIDLNENINQEETSSEVIRKIIGNRPYILASGSSVIEDYKRIISITENFNQIIQFVAQSSLETVKKSPEYLALQQQLSERREQIKSITDRNQKALHKSQIDSLEAQIKTKLTSQLTMVEPWIIDGMKLWISTFLPNRINFRIFPFKSCPSFQIICNLKRDCFVDQDLEHVLYGYGGRPNVPLAVFGLITSLPEKQGAFFNPLSEFENGDILTNKIIFEKAFRGVFGAIDELEDWSRYSRYPNITIHPIAVFRQFQNKEC